MSAGLVPGRAGPLRVPAEQPRPTREHQGHHPGEDAQRHQSLPGAEAEALLEARAVVAEDFPLKYSEIIGLR